MNLYPIFKSFWASYRFYSRSGPYLAPPISPSTLTNLSDPAKVKLPYDVMPSCGQLQVGLFHGFLSAMTYFTALLHRFAECLSTDSPTLAGDFYRVIYKLFTASPIKILLPLPVSIGGWPCLDRFEPNSSHNQRNDWTELCAVFKAKAINLQNNPAANFSTTFSLTCLHCCSVLMTLLVHYCSPTNLWDGHVTAGFILRWNYLEKTNKYKNNKFLFVRFQNTVSISQLCTALCWSITSNKVWIIHVKVCDAKIFSRSMNTFCQVL